MLLAIAATEMELAPLLAAAGPQPDFLTLVCGVGPVAAGLATCKYLQANPQVAGVVLLGIGGAYLQPQGTRQPQLLDLCLAQTEVFGDLGIAVGEEITLLPLELTGTLQHPLDRQWLDAAVRLLETDWKRVHCGNFVTVSAASGTAGRGAQLQHRWQALCENMEGAAVAAACRVAHVSCLEVRAISNLVTDRDPGSWRSTEAAAVAAQAAHNLLRNSLL